MNLENDQEALKVIDAVKLALLELHIYGTTHNIEAALGDNIQELVGAGALSSRTAEFIGSHEVRFHGFRPRPLRGDIPVLEVLLADRAAPLRLTGFRDGHVEVSADKPQ